MLLAHIKGFKMKKVFLLITTLALSTSQVLAESSISKDELSRILKQSLPVLRTVVVGDAWNEEMTSAPDEEGCIEKGTITRQIIKNTSRGYHVLNKTINSNENCSSPTPRNKEFVEYWPHFTDEELTDVSTVTSVKDLGGNRYSLAFEENQETIIDLTAPGYRTIISRSFPDFTETSTYIGIKAVSIPNERIELCTMIPMDDLTQVQVCEKGHYPWLWEKN